MCQTLVTILRLRGSSPVLRHYLLRHYFLILGGKWKTQKWETREKGLNTAIIATGVRPEDCEQKQAKSKAVISCCVFNIC